MRETNNILSPNFFNKKKVINDIRKYRFGENLDTSSIPNDIKRYINIQEKDKEAAANLVKDIYSKKPHFLLELIQNAEDNKYNENVEPKIKFTFDDKKIILQNNELGFNKNNVWALCSIGETTKEKSLGFIGEKGIGFKSVFMISNTPNIFSNGYQFKFNYRNESPLSIIKPYWVEKLPDYINENETNIILPLKDGIKEEIAAIFQINLLLILFLKKVKKIIIENKLKDKTNTIEKKTLGKNILILRKEYTTHSDQEKLRDTYKKEYWRLIKKSFTVPPMISDTEPKRKDITETELILAFPITEKGNAITNTEQNVHVYLPINPYGFRFIIHGDLLTPPDRERFHEDRKWNLWLRDQVSSVFLDAANDFRQDENLKITYYNYIPIDSEIQDKLFSPIVEQIHDKLIKSECIYTESKGWKNPADVFSASKEIRTLISNEEANYLFGKEFLHPEINIRKGIQKALDIKEFKIDHLLQCLKDEKWLQNKPDEWLINLYSFLERNELNDEQEEKISDLKIIRLENNNLVSPSDTNAFFPLEKETKYSFENDLPFIKKNIYANLLKDEEGNLIGKKFLEYLGVKKTTPKVLVRDYILPLYRDNQWLSDSSGNNVDHIRYIKDNFKEIKNIYGLIDEIKKTILLRNIKGKKIKSYYYHPEDLYLPKGYGNENNLEFLFEGIAEEKFVHLQYIKSLKNDKEKIKEWKDFFLKLGVNYVPKVNYYEGSYYSDYYTEEDGYYYKKKNKEKNYIDFETEHWSNEQKPPYIEDWYLSEEFEKILKLEHFKKQKLLIQILSNYWDEYYSAFDVFTYRWFYFYWRRKERESSFFRDLKKYLKIPTISKDLGRPQAVFLNNKEIRDILGDSVDYISKEINDDLMNLLNINTEVDEKSIVNVLISLVKNQCTDKSEYLKLYNFMDQEFTELSHDAFSKDKLIFIPLIEQNFFSEQEVLWKEVSYIFKSKWPSLREHYPRLKRFFVEKIGVKEEPNIKEYVDLLSEYADKGEVNDQEEKIIFKIYQKLNKYLKAKDRRGNINSIEWWKEFAEGPIFWTANNKFWSNDGDVFINDDDSLYNLFNNKEDFTFLKLPRNFYPKIKYFIMATNLSYLSKTIKTELSINEKPKLLQGFTVKIKSFIPFLRRYFYQFEQDIYKSMKKKRIFEQFKNFECKSIKNLEVKYTLEISYTNTKYFSNQMRKTLLADNTLYIQEDSLENFQIIAIELMHFFENTRGLDDFLLILFQMKSLNEIEDFLKLKNIHELPISEKEEEIEKKVEEEIVSIEDEKVDLDLEEELLEEEFLEDDDIEMDLEEELDVEFEEKDEELTKEEAMADTKIKKIEKSIRREAKIVEHKQKQLEENRTKITRRQRKIEETKSKFDKIKDNIQKEGSIDDYQHDLREVEEDLNLVGKTFEYEYDPAEIAKQTEVEVLTNFNEHRIKLKEERKKVLNDIKTSKGERNLIGSKKTGFWGEEFVFEHLKKKYIDLNSNIKSEENDGIFRLLLDNPIIITYNNWGRIESNKPYDIKINENNKKIYIDVKSTTTNRISPIEITRNELIKMYEQEDFYQIYRVLNADDPEDEIKVIEKPIQLWKERKIIIIPESHSLLYY